ncbi:uncharacterized protein LOC124677327 [Lolium rigidum]|uniref:uncharacterized protein LOC124677327 n=1 Tax=Lolium rigidum TaxID=89674 RepID=UPI001F5E0395|nr:uncharacterized protein LOC124677327 [Lolium rigidum]
MIHPTQLLLVLWSPARPMLGHTLGLREYDVKLRDSGLLAASKFAAMEGRFELLDKGPGPLEGGCAPVRSEFRKNSSGHLRLHRDNKEDRGLRPEPAGLMHPSLGRRTRRHPHGPRF